MILYDPLSARYLSCRLDRAWLHLEQQPVDKVSNHVWYTFWCVASTLPRFLVFPSLPPLIGF